MEIENIANGIMLAAFYSLREDMLDEYDRACHSARNLRRARAWGSARSAMVMEDQTDGHLSDYEEAKRLYNVAREMRNLNRIS